MGDKISFLPVTQLKEKLILQGAGEMLKWGLRHRPGETLPWSILVATVMVESRKKRIRLPYLSVPDTMNDRRHSTRLVGCWCFRDDDEA